MSSAPRGRRRGSAATGLVVFLMLGMLLVLALYGVDRYAVGRAEREAASALQTELGTPQPPQVEISGWPFLPQAVTQDLDSVRVVADGVGTTGGSAVQIARTDLVLTEVRSRDWFRTSTAGHVDGTALIDYGEVGALSAVPLTYAGEGRMQVKLTTGAFGFDVPATVTGVPKLNSEDQTIVLADPEVDLGAVNVPESTAEALLRVLVRPMPVQGLPFGLRLSSLTAEDDGLHVTVVGDDVSFGR